MLSEVTDQLLARYRAAVLRNHVDAVGPNVSKVSCGYLRLHPDVARVAQGELVKALREDGVHAFVLTKRGPLWLRAYWRFDVYHDA